MINGGISAARYRHAISPMMLKIALLTSWLIVSPPPCQTLATAIMPSKLAGWEKTSLIGGIATRLSPVMMTAYFHGMMQKPLSLTPLVSLILCLRKWQDGFLNVTGLTHQHVQAKPRALSHTQRCHRYILIFWSIFMAKFVMS